MWLTKGSSIACPALVIFTSVGCVRASACFETLVNVSRLKDCSKGAEKSPVIVAWRPLPTHTWNFEESAGLIAAGIGRRTCSAALQTRLTSKSLGVVTSMAADWMPEMYAVGFISAVEMIMAELSSRWRT